MKANVKPLEAQSRLSDEYAITPHRTWLLVNQPRKYTAWLHEKFGNAVFFTLNGITVGSTLKGKSFAVVLTPEGAQQILSADPNGYDAFWKDGFTGVTGTSSLWVLEKEAHHRERHLLSPAFHVQHFRNYGDIIRRIAHEKTDAWQPGQKVRALDTTLAISMEVIMRVVFGMEDDPFMEQGRRVLKQVWKTMHPLIVFFPILQQSWFPPWARYARAKNEFAKWVSLYLTERRARNQESDDVLGRMLKARNMDGNPMRDEDICAELITILLAGHETTATALAWALYDLGNHPKELEKLRFELDSLGSDPDPGVVSRLPFLSAVCNETLRLHTLLPEIGREVTEPLKLFERTIQVGDAVAVSIMAIHHDPNLYPEPDQYIPDRFIERNYSPFEFLPFGGGHRRCLGSGLSDFEMRIALAEIVTHWEFEPSMVEREIRHDIAMGPKNGVPLHIKSRRST
jgi:cytochrome P450